MRSHKLLRLVIIGGMALAACAAPTPAPTPTAAPATPTEVVEPTAAPSVTPRPTKALATLIPTRAATPTAAATAEPTAAPTSSQAAWETLPVVPGATDTAREIYQLGLKLGNDPQAFSKIGDCLSTKPLFLAGFDAQRDYRLGSDYAYLEPTLDNFRGSFSRLSLAAHDGMNAASVLNPIWADANACNGSESPLMCEYRVHRPSFAFISLGTNGDWLTGDKYEFYMRQIIEKTMKQGIVPILATKADNVEGDGRFNLIMAKLAAEYDLPLWNFWLASRTLPNYGIADTVYHLTWAPLFFDDAASMQSGWAVRNLTALQALDSVWRGVTSTANSGS